MIVGIAVHKKSGRKKNKSSKEEEEWIKNFLERSDIIFTTSGRRDTVYARMDGCQREHKQKLYYFGNSVTYYKLFFQLQNLLNMKSYLAKCKTSSKSTRRWLTTVTSHTLPLCVKSAKTLHF